ncbi:MAG: VanZ family protein [Saccharofermentanales bacterium]|jgi:glycopeptide antibiotics resistance protein
MLKKKNHKIIAVVLFVVYLAALVYILLFKADSGFSPQDYTAIHQITNQKPSNYNLIPLKTIRLFLNSFLRNQNLPSLLNILGNIMIFVPFGIFIPLFWPDRNSFLITFLSGSLIILLIEFVQLITVWGIMDIDDYLLNILGVILGWLLSRLLIK